MKAVLAAGALAVGLVLAFGLFLFVQGARNVGRAIASSRWPKAAGIVARSGVTKTAVGDRRSRQSSVSYSADTVIVYRVDGREYGTKIVHFGQTLGSSDESEAALETMRFPVGGQASVSYNPRQPWIAAARPGLHAEAFWLPGAGLAFVLPGVMCLLAIPGMWRSMAGPRGMGSPRRGDVGMAAVAGIFAGIFCALGTLALTAGLERIWRGHASLRWPTTLGTVLFAKVDAAASQDRETREVRTTFGPRFVYQYDVAGVRHYNNLRRFGRVEGQAEEWAQEIASRYPVGSRAPVAYQPDDPDVAVLEPGNNGEAYWLPGIGVVALLLGLASFIWIVPAIART